MDKIDKKEAMKSFFSAEDTAKGFEDIDQSTMAIPFLKIAQALSPEMKENKPEYIPGLKLGDMFNNVTQEIYGKEINIIIGKFEHGYTEWLPMRKGFVGNHTVEEAISLAEDKTFGKWKTAEGNILQENYVYYVIVEGREEQGVLIMLLSSSQIKKAKKLNKILTSYVMPNGEKAMPYYLRWNVKTVEEHKDENDWYGYSFTCLGLIQNEKQYLAVKEERKLIDTRVVDYSNMIEDHTSEDSDEGDTGF